MSYLVANNEARFSRDKVFSLVKSSELLATAKYAHSSCYSVPLVLKDVPVALELSLSLSHCSG